MLFFSGAAVHVKAGPNAPACINIFPLSLSFSISLALSLCRWVTSCRSSTCPPRRTPHGGEGNTAFRWVVRGNVPCKSPRVHDDKLCAFSATAVLTSISLHNPSHALKDKILFYLVFWVMEHAFLFRCIYSQAVKGSAPLNISADECNKLCLQGGSGRGLKSAVESQPDPSPRKKSRTPNQILAVTNSTRIVFNPTTM